MSKNRSIGALVVIAAILAIVSFAVLRGATTGSGITITEGSGTGIDRLRAADGGPGIAAGTPGRIRDTAAASERIAAGIGVGAGQERGSTPQSPDIVVQVVGAVKRPGVYHLAPGSRNDDAVKAAGGLRPDANPASLNLAAHALDGSQVKIRTIKEQSPAGDADAASGVSVEPPTDKPDGGAALSPPVRRSAGTTGRSRGSSARTKLKDPSEGTIDINTATAESLQRIPGIGPAMAAKIIAFRAENHGFHSIEDLRQVSGIGAKKLAKFRPFIKIR